MLKNININKKVKVKVNEVKLSQEYQFINLIFINFINFIYIVIIIIIINSFLFVKQSKRQIIKMSSIFSDSTESEEEPVQNQKLTNAYQLLLSGKEQQAIVLYKEIIVENPKLWRAYQNLGVAYIITKRFEEAFEVLYKYVRHVPKDPLGHDSLGVSYSELNDPLQAICSFVNSINLNPSYYMSYYNLGVVLGKLNLNEMALNIYKKCVQLNPYYVNALNNIGDLYKKFNQVDTAIQYFKNVLQIDSNYSLAVKNLGNCYFSEKMYAQALVFYTKFLDVSTSQHQAVYLNLAVCYDHFKLYSEAGIYLMKAYIINPNSTQRFDRCFLAGCLYFRQLHKISTKIRLLVQGDSKITNKVAKQFFHFYQSSLKCFLQANRLLPRYKQCFENIQKLKFNIFGYCAKTGGIYQDLLSLQLGLQPTKQIWKMFKKQRTFVQKIKFWRKHTKKIITGKTWSWESKRTPISQQILQQYLRNQEKQKNNPSQDQQRVLPTQQVNNHQNLNENEERSIPQQQGQNLRHPKLKTNNQFTREQIEQYVYKIAKRKQFDSKKIKFIRKRYVSRARNNFKTLIIKRSNFIKKYNAFNTEIQSFFKLRRMTTSVSEPSQLSVNVVNVDLNLQGAEIDIDNPSQDQNLNPNQMGNENSNMNGVNVNGNGTR